MRLSQKKHGYVYAYRPEHPLAGKNGYVREHRAIWHDAFGPIPTGYHVHHKNGVKDDNRLENLECLTPLEHCSRHLRRGHAHGRGGGGGGRKPSPIIELVCGVCGSNFSRSQANIDRRRRRGLKTILCSKTCGAAHGIAERMKHLYPTDRVEA